MNRSLTVNERSTVDKSWTGNESGTVNECWTKSGEWIKVEQ